MKGPHFWTTSIGFCSPQLCCHLVFALLLLHSSVHFQADADIVEMKYGQSEILCAYVKWKMNFSVEYETENNEYKRADFTLPDDAKFDGSDCGEDDRSILVVEFGDNNYWNLSFTKNGDAYEGTISFTYNTNDTAFFPEAKRKGPVTVVTSYPEQPVPLNTVFTCDGLNSIQTEHVTQYIWEVTLQAFIAEGTLSKTKTHCSQDVPEQLETTPSATAPAIPEARMAPIASVVPPAPMPVITTPSRPSSILQPWARPSAGTYSVKENGTICLLATMAMQLNISEQTEAVLYNINPNTTEVFGTCGNTTSSLTLKDGNKEISFGFAVKNTTNEVFYLKEVKITIVDATNVSHTVANSNMNSWEASMGSSFMCQKKNVLGVTPFYKLNIYNLQVQPFEVKYDQFSTAEECYTREFLYLIPIIVGAVVAFLLFVVFIIYIRRRRKKEANPHSV